MPWPRLKIWGRFSKAERIFSTAVSNARPPAMRAKGSRLPCTGNPMRSEEHTSELQSLMRISYAVFCLKKKKKKKNKTNKITNKHKPTYKKKYTRTRHKRDSKKIQANTRQIEI